MFENELKGWMQIKKGIGINEWMKEWRNDELKIINEFRTLWMNELHWNEVSIFKRINLYGDKKKEKNENRGILSKPGTSSYKTINSVYLI